MGEQSRQGRKRGGWGTGGWQGASHSSLLPQPAPLYVTPGHLLDKFIKDFLQPNRTFLDRSHLKNTFKKSSRRLFDQISEYHGPSQVDKINHHNREGGLLLSHLGDVCLLCYRGSQWELPGSCIFMVLDTRVARLSPLWPVCSWACFPSLMGGVSAR